MDSNAATLSTLTQTSLLIKTYNKPIGCGTFGLVFLTEYRGMKAVVKEMKRRNESYKETERFRSLIIDLGDHPNLLFLLGICTEKEPLSLVIQFYGKFVVERMLRQESTAVFQEIVNTWSIFITRATYIRNAIFFHMSNLNQYGLDT